MPTTELTPITQKILALLQQNNVVDEFQSRAAAAQQAKWGGSICKHIADLGFAAEDAMTEVLARAFNLPPAQLAGRAIDKAAITRIPLQVAQDRMVYPWSLQDNGRTLWIAVVDPSDLETVDFVAQTTRCRVRVALAGESELRRAIQRGYGLPEESAGHSARSPAPPAAPNPNAIELALDGAPTLGAPVGNSHTPPSLGTLFAVQPTGSGDSTLEAQVITLRLELDTTRRALRALIEVCVERNLIHRTDVGTMVKRLKDSGK